MKEYLAMLFVLFALLVAGTMDYNDAVERERMSAEEWAKERLDDCPPATREKRDREALRIAGLNGDMKRKHSFRVVTEADCGVHVESVKMAKKGDEL